MSLDREVRELSLALNRVWDEIAVVVFVPIARRLGLKIKPRYEMAARRKEKRDSNTEEQVVRVRDRHRVVNVRYECVNGQGRFVEPLGYHLLGHLRWEYEYELDEATAQRATWEIPKWAQSPTANIIGTWHAVRRRLVTRLGVPLGPWRELSNTESRSD